jgi:hypothetical protein
MGLWIPPRPPGAVLVDDDYAVTAERFLNVDASGGNVVITVPAATVGTHHGARKCDDSANTVTVNEDGGGTLFTLTAQRQIKHAFSNGSAYTVK